MVLSLAFTRNLRSDHIKSIIMQAISVKARHEIINKCCIIIFPPLLFFT